MSDDQTNLLTEVRIELAQINVTLQAQETNLREHMRRSEANEKAVVLLEKTLVSHISRVNVIIAIAAAVGLAILTVLIKTLLA